MTVESARSRIKARVWQALAQSDLKIKELPQGELEELVDLVSNAALFEIDEELELALGSQKEPEKTEEGEEVLWEGRPLLSIATRYVITNERVSIIEGILGRSREDIELVRVQDVDHSQSFGERLFSVGDVTIHSHDPSHPTAELNNVRDPEAVHEVLRRAVLEARKRHGLRYREEM